MSNEESYRAGFVGVVGLPNAGKSTLVNALIGEKVSIVTSKAQTTRQRIQGILTEDDAQYVFVDAPGVIKANSGLNKFLQDEAEDVRENSDVLMAVLNIDCDNPKKLQQIVDWVAETGKPWMAVVNKTDLPQVHRASLIERMLFDYDVPVVTLSSNKFEDHKRIELLEALRPLMPESPAPLYDDELYTTQSMRQLAGEIIREKCFQQLKKEIPYGLAVRISSFKEEKVPKIHADILISKDNYRSIIIGAGGQRLRDIGTAARKDLEEVMDSKVFLNLHVSVKKKWMTNNSHMKELGYVNAE